MQEKVFKENVEFSYVLLMHGTKKFDYGNKIDICKLLKKAKDYNIYKNKSLLDIVKFVIKELYSKEENPIRQIQNYFSKNYTLPQQIFMNSFESIVLCQVFLECFKSYGDFSNKYRSFNKFIRKNIKEYLYGEQKGVELDNEEIGIAITNRNKSFKNYLSKIIQAHLDFLLKRKNLKDLLSDYEVNELFDHVLLYIMIEMHGKNVFKKNTIIFQNNALKTVYSKILEKSNFKSSLCYMELEKRFRYKKICDVIDSINTYSNRSVNDKEVFSYYLFKKYMTKDLHTDLHGMLLRDIVINEIAKLKRVYPEQVEFTEQKNLKKFFKRYEENGNINTRKYDELLEEMKNIQVSIEEKHKILQKLESTIQLIITISELLFLEGIKLLENDQFKEVNSYFEDNKYNNIKINVSLDYNQNVDFNKIYDNLSSFTQNTTNNTKFKEFLEKRFSLS